jgi:hypothetical protein
MFSSASDSGRAVTPDFGAGKSMMSCRRPGSTGAGKSISSGPKPGSGPDGNAVSSNV